MKTLSLTSLLLTALSIPAFSQAVSFGSQPIDTTPPKDAEPSATSVAKVDTISELDQETESALLASPSRYVGLDVDNYVQAITTSFSMRSRDIDPFARHQDPNFKPVQPVITKSKVKKFEKKPEIPFSDHINRIDISFVSAARGIFLVNGREFRVGSRINLNVGGEDLLPIHVVKIKSSGITFRHGRTQELAVRPLNVMPRGMSPGNQGEGPAGDYKSTPPGVVSKADDLPLDVRPTGYGTPKIGTINSPSRR